jgi:hypothetical protein
LTTKMVHAAEWHIGVRRISRRSIVLSEAAQREHVRLEGVPTQPDLDKPRARRPKNKRQIYVQKKLATCRINA